MIVSQQFYQQLNIKKKNATDQGKQHKDTISMVISTFLNKSETIRGEHNGKKNVGKKRLLSFDPSFFFISSIFFYSYSYSSSFLSSSLSLTCCCSTTWAYLTTSWRKTSCCNCSKKKRLWGYLMKHAYSGLFQYCWVRGIVGRTKERERVRSFHFSFIKKKNDSQTAERNK